MPTIEMLASNAAVINRTSCLKPSFQMLSSNNITILPSGKFGEATHVRSGQITSAAAVNRPQGKPQNRQQKRASQPCSYSHSFRSWIHTGVGRHSGALHQGPGAPTPSLGPRRSSSASAGEDPVSSACGAISYCNFSK